MFNIRTVELEGREFHIPTWNLVKQLQNQNVVMPLIKEPLVNAMSLTTESDISEGIFIAAIMDGVIEALATVDMLKLSQILLEDVGVKSAETGTVVQIGGDVKLLEKEGIELSAVLSLCVHVIKENYGSLLKKDFSGLLGTLLGSDPQEKPASTKK